MEREELANGRGDPVSSEYIQEPMAIVGMACRFPGDASSPAKFWDMLTSGTSAQSGVPKERFNIDSFHHPELKRPGSIPVNGGYFIQEDLRSFDPAFFGIRPAEAKAMDPQHRKLLEVTYECIESAGLVLGDLAGSDTGVYMANFTKDFLDIHIHGVEYPPDYKWVGSTDTLLSNRISYTFDLHGPSLTLDTACSGSMYALHAACTAIQAGECSSAFVGGANLILSPEQMMDISKGGVLSPTGTCHTFDESADGYGRADGVGVLYVKRLADAFEKNDPVVAVIRGTATSANGKTNGITHPSREGQRRTIEACYRRAGNLDPLKTAYVECHGTGTRVGDPVEVSAIADVFSPGRLRHHPLLLGSVKTNIGHSEPTSAIAGLIKTALALKTGIIPPTVGIRNFASTIKWEDWNVSVITKNTKWPESSIRRASVNSFGYGGANSHTILEAFSPDLVLHALNLRHRARGEKNPTLRYTQSVLKATNLIQLKSPTSLTNGHSFSNDEDSLYLLCISGHDPQAVERNARALSQVSDVRSLQDLAYTLGSRRTHFTYRAAAVANIRSFQQQLKTAVVHKKPRDRPAIAFVFTGQGAQWPAMGKSLSNQFKFFRDSLKELDAILTSLDDGPSWSLIEMLSSSSTLIHEPEFSQPLCTALQIALVQLLRHWNVTPRATLGHSSGEIAAAYAAGLLTSKQAILLAYYRGLAAKRAPQSGAMLAVQMNSELAESALASSGVQRVEVACINSPESVTLSGAETEVLKVENRLRLEGIFNRRLRTGGRAYHSYQMREIGPWYLEKCRVALQAAENTDRTLPHVPMISSVTGTRLPNAFLDASYWKTNLEAPVRFNQSMQELLQQSDLKVDTLIEIGPHSALGGPISQVKAALKMSDTELKYLSTLKRDSDPAECLLRLAGKLYTTGHPISLDATNRIDDASTSTGEVSILTDIPGYQWSKEIYWTDNRHSMEFRYRKHPRHDLLGSLVPGVCEYPRLWRNLLRLSDLRWLEDHKVGKQIVFPAAGYIAMAVEGISQLSEDEGLSANLKDKQCYILKNFKVKKALQFSAKAENSGVEILLEMRPVEWSNSSRSHDTFDFKITSLYDGQWSENALGTISLRSEQSSDISREDPSHIVWNPVKTDRAYEKLANLGLEYGQTFRRLDRIGVRPRSSEDFAAAHGLALLGPAKLHESNYAIHPASIDTCLQLALIALPDIARLPVFVEQLTIWNQERPLGFESASVCSKVTVTGLRSISINGSMKTSEGKPLMDIQNFRCISVDIEAWSSTQHSSNPYTRLTRKPDITLLKPGQLNMTQPWVPDTGRQFDLLERLTLLCMIQFSTAHPELLELKENDTFGSYKQFIANKALMPLVDNRYADQPSSISDLTPEERMHEIEKTSAQLHEEGVMDALLVRRIFDNIGPIITGAALPLEVVLEDDLWARFYEEGLCFRAGNQEFRRAIDLLAHKSPSMDIIELGAGTGGLTKHAFNVLQATSPHMRYHSYTFTDISSGFFPTAREKFSRCHNVSYSTLDITASITDQGFTAGGYDLIIAGNVIHATENLSNTLRNIRGLLKPGGTILLVEATRDFLLTGWIFGSFSGWWLGKDDARLTSGALAPVEKWNSSLIESGYTGIQNHFPDYPEPYATVSTLLSSIPQHDTSTVVRDTKTELALNLQQVCQRNGNSSEIHLLRDTECLTKGTTVLLADLERPLLADLDEDELAALKGIQKNADRLLWITSTGLCDVPLNAMSLGFTRAMREELQDLPLYSLDMEVLGAPHEVAMRIWRHLGSILNGKAEHEAVDIGGVSYVERLVPDEKLRRTAYPPKDSIVQFHEKSALKMNIETIGLFDTIFFSDDEMRALPLARDEVELQVKAVGMNMKDVVNLMGQVDQKFFSVEATGVVTRIGNAVSGLQVGDHVMCLGQGYYGTYKRTKELLCAKMHSDETFSDMATMPVVFCTALYCLKELARLREKESILIHSAAGGVGLAAVQIAQKIGAKVYVTAGSPAKRAYLRDTYGIPEGRIFNSRDKSFQTAVLAATRGKGVDVILNSVVNELLHETFSCLSTFGRHVELGNRDIVDRGRLGMQAFDGSKTFTFFYLGDLMIYRPEIVQELLKTILTMYRSKEISSIKPVKTFDVSAISRAMRYFTEGKHMGKIVITYEAEESPVKYRPQRQILALKSDATYLIVGGLGGLGRSLALRMYERGARSFLFLSRSGSDKPEARRLVESLESLGASVCVAKGDVTNEKDVSIAIRMAPFPIRGVIHAAMVLQDQFFDKLTLDDLRVVRDPKVHGSINLHYALQQCELDFFVMTSSISGGIIAFVGQSSYGASNAFLDALARYRLSKGLPAVSVNIGMIVDVGIVDGNESLELYLRRMGLYGINEDDFLAAMELSMFSCPKGKTASTSVELIDDAQLVLGFEAARIRDHHFSASRRPKLPWLTQPRLSVIAGALEATETKGQRDESIFSERRLDVVRRTYEASGGDKARAVLQKELMENLANMLCTSADELDSSEGFSAYGLDSMLAAELRVWMYKEFDVNVTLLQLLSSGFTLKMLEDLAWEKSVAALP